ncbi:MAG: enoyl-CoA hydratase/isomerase family protein [Deltaproteobacteria bacterium]|nr:enoyl-CoA hydratase/isomerase family protein [Deltaproteobacteria bacterium]
MNDGFEIERRGTVALFRIQRADQANAITRQVLIGLGRFAREQGSDAQVRALIVTAAGNKHFCAGADLKERVGWTHDDIRTQLALYRSELGALDTCPKPVVAALNGLAFGGGLEIALACDLRVAVASASFALPEVTLAIIPGAGGTQRLPRIVGEARAKEMILFGQRISAQQALAWGLINRIADPQVDIVDDAIGWIEPILGGAPLAHASALAAIDAARPDPVAGLQAEQAAYERLLGTEDRLEGLRAFAEKRKPVYVGR